MLKLVLVFTTQLLTAAAPPQEGPAYDAAKQHFNEGRYEQAAAGFENLWKQSPNPKYLHYAAMAWAGLGRDTHAIVNWQRVVQTPGASAKISADANEFLVEAFKRAPAVTLQLPPEAANEAWNIELTPEQGPPIAMPLSEARKPDSPGNVIHLTPGKWTITLTGPSTYQPATAEVTVAEGTPMPVNLAPAKVAGTVQLQVQPLVEGATAVFRDEQGVQPEVQHTLANGSSVSLPPGRWTVTINAQGYHPYTVRVVSTAGQVTELPVTLRATGPGPQPPPDPEELRVPHPKLALGLGIGAGVVAVAGGVLIGVGEGGIARAENPNATKVVADRRDQFAGGAALLGGGVGLGITALIARNGMKKKKDWYIPLLSGLAVGAAGGVWFGLTSRTQYNDLEDFAEKTGTVTSGWVTKMRANVYGSTLLSGMGAGLAAGALGGLIADGRTPRTRTSFGVTIFPLSGSFRLRF